MALHRKDWYKHLNNDKVYVNSFLSRPYMIFKDKTKCNYYFEMIKKLWNEKDIIIIEGYGSRLGVGNDLFNGAKSVCRILCPPKNAYEIMIKF